MAMRSVLWIVIAWSLSATVDAKGRASKIKPLLPSPPDQHGLQITRSRLFLLRREWTKKKVRQSRIPVSKPGKGSMLTFDVPTPQKLSAWFWDLHHKPMQCNHGDDGMTRPRLKTWVDGEDLSSSSSSSGVVVEASNRSDRGAEDAWWPNTGDVSSKWRALRFRRRVGRGTACYERVKEKALGWEFRSPTKGICNVAPRLRTPSGRLARNYEVYENAWAPCGSDRIQQVFAGAGRRLATIASVGPQLPFLPRLRAINPVVVVYELPEEKGPGGTTYASTAYATAEGHWLRGEERVTVALRETGHVDVEILSFSKPAPSVMGRLSWPWIGRMQRSFFEDEMDALARAARPLAP